GRGGGRVAWAGGGWGGGGGGGGYAGVGRQGPGRAGWGDGRVGRRGYTRPPAFHIDRLREAPAGHFFEVMSQGFGAMPSYAAQVPVRDRWAIAAYIRALQRSQHATLADVPAAARGPLEREVRE